MKYEVARTVEGWISRKSLGLSSYSTKEQKDAKAMKVRTYVRVDKKGHERQYSFSVFANIKQENFLEVVWAICTCKQAEGEGEFGRDLGDDIVSEAALDQRRVPHEVVHRVRHLHQLAVGEI
jgi:hypothetical protein